MRTWYKPGEKVPTSGQYAAFKASNYLGQVTCVKGEPFPPFPIKGVRYKLTDRTRHKKGKK